MPARALVKNSVKLFLMSLSGFLPEKTIPILLYHSVDDSQSEDSVSPQAFFNQMEFLHQEGYRTISLDEIENGGNGRTHSKPSKILAITFDDGYKSIYEFALPILQRFHFTAGVFLPTKYIGKSSEWTMPPAPLLTWDEILAMKDCGIQFGSHGHSHRNLTALPVEQVKEELELSRKILEDKLGTPVNHISYPFSRSNGMIENMARECGYKRSFSGIGGKDKQVEENHFVVPRRSVMKQDDMLSFRFVLANTYPYYFRLKRLVCMSFVG